MPEWSRLSLQSSCAILRVYSNFIYNALPYDAQIGFRIAIIRLRPGKSEPGAGTGHQTSFPLNEVNDVINIAAITNEPNEFTWERQSLHLVCNGIPQMG